jgi:deoxyribodipyrimidine photo-lyase
VTEYPTALVWLRNDLRLADNPALLAATQSARQVTALYIHETDPSLRPTGAAARWWLHQSLVRLEKSLAGVGIRLLVRTGLAGDVVRETLTEIGAEALHWNRRYGPAERDIDSAIKAGLRDSGVTVVSHAGNLLAEPWTTKTGQGKPYSVFTPFWKTLRDTQIARPLPPPEPIDAVVSTEGADGTYVEPHWAEKLHSHWDAGEDAARERLADFLDGMVAAYPGDRDIPAKDGTSRLSPHLRFGEISPRQIWHAARLRAELEPELAGGIEKFLSELAWRDFSYCQLYHREDISRTTMQLKFSGLAWREAPEEIGRWQRGQTGFPIIDAGMRELWETGYMHNRVRMLVASLLTKNLQIDWRLGEAWFWDCLVDADVANNPASWQWVAGSGLDAAPYFRIFNPVTQGERFDPAGNYVRHWVPEIAGLPDKWVHKPFAAPEPILKAARITLGQTYPHPVVDLAASRLRALEGFAQLGNEFAP